MPGKIRTAQSVSFDVPADQQPYLHNRWHPEIPSVGSIEPGETVKIECLDWTGGQIGNNDSANDVRDIDLSKIHYLTGPFDIKGAEPGDLLVVNITDIQPFDHSPWGFTGVFDKANGGGFLAEHYPRAAKAIWDFDGIYCASRHIPGVRFPGLIHPGILGCAPSAEVLAAWNRREGSLVEAGAATHPGKTLAHLPQERNVHATTADGELKARIAREGARTVPGRPEHGGNVDICNISRGSKTYLPVHVPGAKFSVGDLHFSQGDGEISFCGAIEMAGVITIKFDLIKNGVKSRAVPHPVFLPGEVQPHYGPSRYLTFEGFSVDEEGEQHYMDATIAYRQACLRAIEYLKQFGYSGEQIYLLLSCAPVRGSIAGIVDIPNVCTTLGVPMDIFDFDISIEKEPVKRDLGSCTLARTVSADAQDTEDMATLSRRRVADLAEFPDPSWFGRLQEWIDSQKVDGTWADVNSLSGCQARRANWPIQDHWNRVITLAAAWGGNSLIADQKWTNSTKAWDAISRGLDYWFKNDYEPAACMGDGGNATLGCPCGTPGLWNTNWYDQAILIPQLSSTACLLARDGNLSDQQRTGCIRLTRRTYDNIDLSYGTGGNLTAANVVLVLQSAVSLGLFTENVTIVENAMKRAFSVMTLSDEAMQDGIHSDGSFLQHKGILYNGNYGKDSLNIFIQLEGEAVGTRFAANDATREATSTYIKGDEWMIYTDQKTRQQHWDFNVIGRFVSYPTQDLQASADINVNVTKLARAVADFDGPYNVNSTIKRLESNGTAKLTGNKGFWASDYMIHRRESFVIGNKMFSTRSTNSELINGANPLGYHLGQGTLFTYVDGTEYKDIWASWDWNLVPGTTVVRNRPALTATAVQHRGKRDFVGVVSDGRLGVSVEDYVDPSDGHIAYKKAWFYLDDAVLVSVTDIQTSNASGNAPTITVLENRAKADGGAFVNGRPIKLGNDTRAAGSTLFYGGNGYLAYDSPFNLTLSEGERTGNWSAISTSTAGLATAAIFSAYMTIDAPGATYAMFPATTQRKLAQEAEKPSWAPLTGDGISGAAGQGMLGLVFWPGGNRCITVDLAVAGWADEGAIKVTSGQPGVYLLTGRSAAAGALKLNVSAADPTQKLETAALELLLTRPVGAAAKDACSVAVRWKADFAFVLPTGGMAGSSVKQEAVLQLV